MDHEDQQDAAAHRAAANAHAKAAKAHRAAAEAAFEEDRSPTQTAKQATQEACDATVDAPGGDDRDMEPGSANEACEDAQHACWWAEQEAKKDQGSVDTDPFALAAAHRAAARAHDAAAKEHRAEARDLEGAAKQAAERAAR